ncbi:phosphoglucosamine mutase [Geoglobus acetivorans]|uniref:Phosphomannomutase n=1 Tax=Geoglobus acetivorans TaxID=565033 RepID=A0A0A7GDG8_GEOAI|nr:Phosphomannomutase [Geoglobus acetivorans]
MERSLFGTNGVRGIANEELTAELALDLGRTIASLREGIIAVGMDARISSPMLKSAVLAGIMSAGGDAVDVGVAPTPSLQYYVKSTDAKAGVIVTASHNPREYNGIKFVSGDGTEFSREEDAEAERVLLSKKFRRAAWNEVGSVFSDDANRIYVAGILNRVNTDIIAEREYRVVIDCGNGAASFTSPEIARRLNCRTYTINCYPDGRFPARASEPVEENVSELKDVVKAVKADLGVAHDGDADRATFVDEKGNFVSEDVMLALMAKYYVEMHNGGVVVTPVSTSRCVEDAVREAGGEVIYTAVGSPVVAKVMKEKNAVFGGEGNGGLIFPEHLLARDGGMSLAKVLELMAEENKPLSELVKDIPHYVTLKTKVECRDKKRLLEGLRAEFEDANFTDGARIDFEDGWLLIRPSGTEPIARIFAEAKDEKKAKELLEAGIEKVKKILTD